MEGILEGLLFVSGDEGLSIDQLSDILEIDKDSTKTVIKNLATMYENNSRGIRLNVMDNRIRLITKIEYKDYYKKLIDNDNDVLTDSSLETLAIIAYNQPIIRSKVDEIRGVDSSYHIKKLLLKELIEEKGKSELPGRPILYGTSTKFLDHFGLHSLSELPVIKHDEDDDNDEIGLFESKYQENNK